MKDYHLKMARPIWLMLCVCVCFCNCHYKIFMKENFWKLYHFFFLKEKLFFVCMFIFRKVLDGISHHFHECRVRPSLRKGINA